MNPEKRIACCGFDCAACEALVATCTNDDALRAKKAEEWKKLYNIPHIPIEAINCTGCREAGPKIEHCEECEIKNCVISRKYQTCADCELMEHRGILGKMTKYVPEAIENLSSLKKSEIYFY